MDVDGQYRGLDHNIHQTNGFVNYSVFSLWDTYRALHPLFTLIQPERALAACIASATHRSYGNLGDYMDLGYVPYELNAVGSSMTLEYAYDDWTIAQMAKSLGETTIAAQFEKRANNWKNLFNEKTGFVGAKDSKGNWKTPFDPMHTAYEGFIEGNAWNYSLYVPQDINTMIQKMGGNKRFVAHLDSLFTMYMPDKYFAETEDITREGLVGCYVHGNEPSHHVAYLYNWAGQPWKTQERIHQIVNTMYLNKPDGLCGNDDCGQMSAWYVFSTLGLYPVCPGSGEYAIGSPSVNKGTIQLGKGKSLVVRVNNLSDKNFYVKSVKLNGKPLTTCFLSNIDINSGGELIFEMSNQPNKFFNPKNNNTH